MVTFNLTWALGITSVLAHSIDFLSKWMAPQKFFVVFKFVLNMSLNVFINLQIIVHPSKFNYVTFAYFYICFLCLRRQIQKYVASIYIKECSACIFF